MVTGGLGDRENGVVCGTRSKEIHCERESPAFSPMAGRYIIRAGAVDVRAVDPSRMRVSDRVVGNSTVTISRSYEFLYSANWTW